MPRLIVSLALESIAFSANFMRRHSDDLDLVVASVHLRVQVEIVTRAYTLSPRNLDTPTCSQLAAGIEDVHTHKTTASSSAT